MHKRYRKTRRGTHFAHDGVMDRRSARETAFGLLFEKEFKREDDDEELILLAEQARDFEDDPFVRKLYYGVTENLSDIDGKIDECAIGWKRERMSLPSLTIMRMAIYEMLYCDDIPFAVSLNEAVELAKKFDDEKAPSFVNGVLDKIAEKEGLKERK